MMKMHPSSLGLIMADAKSIDPALLNGDLLTISKKKVKTDEDKELLEPLWDKTLSAGAKTFLTSLAKEFIFGYHETITTKYMDKGIAVEDKSIQLYNDVFFTNFSKNSIRKENDILTGEIDILTPGKIVDIKSAWSLSTFPVTSEDAHESLYEWQGRGYMALWNIEEFEVAYCMVSTPEELIRYEQPELHQVDHIDPCLRVTRIQYKRDLKLEAKIRTKCLSAQKFLAEKVEQIKLQHTY